MAHGTTSLRSTAGEHSVVDIRHPPTHSYERCVAPYPWFSGRFLLELQTRCPYRGGWSFQDIYVILRVIS